MGKITPFLWFDSSAEEAAHFYAGIFKNSSIGKIARNGDQVLSVEFMLEGQALIALNGGPAHPFTDAISLFIGCETQAEVDDLWAKLSAGGSEGRCGWLKDRYGLSWQVIPTRLSSLLNSPDRAGAARALQAMLTMNKLDVDALQRAHDAEEVQA